MLSSITGLLPQEITEKLELDASEADKYLNGLHRELKLLMI